MSKLRKSAKGQQCMVRVPSICNWNPETTVLAHIGGAGMALKNNDLFGAFCCSSCHDAIDGRIKTSFTRDELSLMHYEGMKRTQEYWLSNEMIKIV